MAAGSRSTGRAGVYRVQGFGADMAAVQQDCRVAPAAPADCDRGLFDSASLLKDAVTKEATLGDTELERWRARRGDRNDR